MLSKEIIKVINEENIHLLHDNLNDDILGTFLSIDGLNIILVNDSIINDSRLYNTVVSEELGHYSTSKKDLAPYLSNTYRDDLNYKKSENKALKWAVNFLIPTKDLLRYISVDFNVNKFDLSDYFDVTESFIMSKFYYLSLNKSQYQLDSGRFLILSHYPSVYIYSNLERRNENGPYSKTC